VIREPEGAWWRAQNEWDARRSAGALATAERDEPIVTVALVGDSETGWNTDAVVFRLAELAASDELLVVYGQSGAGHHAVVAGMRGRLPRHDIVALHVEHRDEVRGDAGDTLNRLLDDGCVPVVVTAAADARGVTAEISTFLKADRVLRVFRTAAGADLHQVWPRPPMPGAGSSY
jgi:hypothetical protein